MAKTHKKRDIEKIIERMREATCVNNDVNLAKYLGIASNSVTSWKSQQTIPYKYIDVISENTSLPFEWFLDGKSGGGEPADPQTREMVSIMAALDNETRVDLLRQAKKELEILELKRTVEGFTAAEKRQEGPRKTSGAALSKARKTA